MSGHSWNFYTYLAILDMPGQKLDFCIPFLMEMYLNRKITIFNGANVWHSDDEAEVDIVLGMVQGVFIPTKVGKYKFS